MKITYFFRKHNISYHSIENVFSIIQQNLPKEVNYLNYYLPRMSTGIINRLLNCWHSIFKQQEINHITGDIHYIGLFLHKNKTILTIHDIEVLDRNSGLKRLIIKLFWFDLPSMRVKLITTISDYSRNELIKKLHFPERKVVVINNPLSTEFGFQPKPFNQECPLILQIGTKTNKNIPSLIKALSGISCKLVIIGKLNDELLALLSSYKINYENFLNFTLKEMVGLYVKSDIVTLISTCEGFGMPIIEANATGRPVIAGNVTSMPEVAGNAALLVDPYNIEQIRSAFIEVIHNEKLRNELIMNGLENIKRFSPEVIALKYFNLYTSMVND
jgi:glycosyltransferase involved in cell wall biosynthesis